MKKINHRANTAREKSTDDEIKVNKTSLDDKDEKVRKHRATDIQKPVINKKSE